MTTETKWSIDHAHSEIAFIVEHLVIAHVKGIFKIFDASICTKGRDFTTAEIELSLDASSITTGNPKRDLYLKSSDVFDVQNHKQITFTSRAIGKSDHRGNHELYGELTIKGLTKIIKLNLRSEGIRIDQSGSEKAGFTVIGEIDRSEWDLNLESSQEAGAGKISKTVTVVCKIELGIVWKKNRTMKLKDMINFEDML